MENITRGAICIILWIIFSFIGYFAGAFYSVSLMIVEWSAETRLCVLFFSGVAAFFIGAVLVEMTKGGE